jgi:amino acid adenylation domain-containing protein
LKSLRQTLFFDIYKLINTDSMNMPDPSVEILEPFQKPVTEQFMILAARNPELIAVSQGNSHWSYGELADKVGLLATTIHSHGFERGDVIAIVGSRSLATITAMLSVLMAGCVFITIDNALPVSRQKLIAEQANAKAILCAIEGNSFWQILVEEEPNLKLISIDAETGDLLKPAANLASNELPVINGNDAAYIFFTSGSTGIPKGILGVHKGLSHFVNWQRDRFSIGPGDRVSQLTNIAFDVVLRDIFTPLTSGATICIPNENEQLNPLPWLAREHISVVHTTPTLLQSWLLMMTSPADLSSLRWLFVAGEPLTHGLITKWRANFATYGQMVNLYGPTETTMAKCFYPIPEQPSPGIQPVGHLLPQTQALVLAEDGRLCDVGELGEIVLRTPFRSLGYINLPTETRQRFRQNPFRDDGKDLLYFTDDLGRYRADGLLEIVGRSDDQVKIRGVRVEPAEVMACLANHEAVQSCYVLARKNDDGQSELVAYVVLKVAKVADTRQLRSHLSSQLPAAFVPGIFVFIDSLPRLPNGKVDRKALPAPTQAQPILDAGFVAPHTPLQQQLAEIWRTVLKIETIGIHDNFFELGGHSLLAVMMISKINEQCRTRLPLGIIYQAPTLEQLANVLAAGDQQPLPYYSVVPIQTQGTRPPLFAIHTITLRSLPRELGADQSLYFLRYGMAAESHDHAVKLPGLEDLAAHYIDEMQRVQPTGPYYLIGFSFGGLIAYEMARQLIANGEQVNLLGLLDSYLTMDKLPLPWHQKILRLLKQPSARLLNILKNKIADRSRISQYGTDFWPHIYTAEPDAICRIDYQISVYDGKATLFQGDEWDSVFSKYALPEGAWRALLGDRLEVQQITGAHFQIFDEPHVKILATKIIACMDKAMAT